MRFQPPSNKRSSDHGSLSSDGDFASTNLSSTEQEASAAEKERLDGIARKETQLVHSWKLTTLLTILVVAIVVSVGCFMILDRQEQDEFETSFRLFAKTIQDATEFHVKELFVSVKDVAEQITREAAARKETFPFVTVPLFEVLGQQAREISGFESLYWGPRLEPEMEAEWINYTVDNQDWLRESRLLELKDKNTTWEEKGYDDVMVWPFVYEIDQSGPEVQVHPPLDQDGPWEPYWQMSPPITISGLINYNLLAAPYNHVVEAAADKLRRGVIDQVRDFTNVAGLGMSVEEHGEFHASLGNGQSDGLEAYSHPHANFIQPIFSDIFEGSESLVVGHVFALFTWDRYLINLLPDGVRGITFVLRNSCGQAFSYAIDGNTAYYLGEKDAHQERYDFLEVVIPFYSFDNLEEAKETEGHCMYHIHVYPTKEFENEYKSSLPLLITAVVIGTFCFLVLVFFTYDAFVSRRNKKMLNAVAKSNAIVSSLFPSNVRDRLFNEGSEETGNKKSSTGNGKSRLKNYLSSGANSNEENDEEDKDFYKTKPIADLFTDTTILFADLAGFTAWSSTREPSQVFILLETIYKAFDDIAKTRRVFKVETVGDCYVAVTGLPDPRKDHAVVMARFAVDCMHKMHSLTKKLEVRLGPDTSELDMRFGIHSGPVTAGVLRGERSRFQLFGDTMNTASRIETSGLPGKIHISQETADLLIATGKQHWLTPREDKIMAKGKGELQTYWLTTSKSPSDKSGAESENGSDSHVISMENLDDLGHVNLLDAKTERLVSWNVDVLLSLLKQVVARRGPAVQRESVDKSDVQWKSTTVLEEVSEIISLPHFDECRQQVSAESVDLGKTVEDQLRQYVSSIASMYRSNPFHNFEHASHVTMSVVKLMSRIVAPDVDDLNNDDMESTLHDYTYGITSDPLTQFACVISALIHDVDHCGIPNSQLIVENPDLASFYKNKSVAEQNSVDLSWDLLQDDSFIDLRAAIYTSPAEQKRFRQLVVNSVMATDIMDKDLKTLRNARWARAFSETKFDESSKDIIDRKATIVIEHLIQASDVAHTMQHWHIYRKWNQRLFEEMYCAFVEGRAANDPSEGWYKGELGFYDFYIIPLAKKLKDCGVFGVSSDEYLNYAEKNRAEWEHRGQEVVSKMIEEVQQKYGKK